MPELKDVLEDVEREVKRIGEDVPKLRDQVEKDLKAVRDIADEANRKADESGQTQNDVKALAEGLAEKHAAIAETVKKIEDEALKAATDRLDSVEKLINRLKLGGSGAGEDTAFKLAREFFETKAVLSKQLKPGEVLADEAVNVEEFKAYEGAFRRACSNRQGEHGLTADEQKAMSIGVDPDGGYLHTPAMSARTLEIIRESSPVRELATVESITSGELKLPIDDDESGAAWAGETEARPETTTAQVGVQTIPVNELYAFPKATQQFIEDAGVDVTMWMARKVGEKFGRTEATAFVSGNGVKRPRGFLTYPAGTSRGQIEQVNSGNATLVTFDGLINLTTALKGFYKANAVFMMKRTTVGAVMLLKDGNGQYLWRPNNQAGEPSLLLGYPVREGEDMPAVGAGNLSIAFGDFRGGYTIVDRLGMSTLVDPYTAKPFVGFYTRNRVGGDVTTFEAIKLQLIAA